MWFILGVAFYLIHLDARADEADRRIRKRARKRKCARCSARLAPSEGVLCERCEFVFYGAYDR